jgi:hypothetical protein
MAALPLRKVRCALCGARHWRDAGYDDRGELVVEYYDDEGRTVEVCSCGHRLGEPAPRQEMYVGWDGREYPRYE